MMKDKKNRKISRAGICMRGLSISFHQATDYSVVTGTVNAIRQRQGTEEDADGMD